ncbi:MAG TPA: protein translocase subunit SecF [Methylomirabilota bacterium]|jgi:preprotein translocase subunit SecF|nr:protein translocase subunit SecF [Methylomirabilota bacterium]
MELIPPGTTIDFVGKRRFFLAFSVIVNLTSVLLLLTWGLNYGLDFTGGTLVEVRFRTPITIHEVRQAIRQEGTTGVTIQELGHEGNLFLIRMARQEEGVGDMGARIREGLVSVFSEAVEVLRVESVGSRVSAELRQKAIWAVIFATVLMGVYIAMRFAPRFGVGAIIALIHDVLVVLGALVLTQMPFDLSVLAALLTVLGYSINDTIIVSDRMRENLRKLRREPLARIINRSLNETLSRTLMTSGTALLVLGVLFAFGGHVIRPFAFTLIVGFLTGVYSSIYIAAPVVLYFDKSGTPVRSYAAWRAVDSHTSQP